MNVRTGRHAKRFTSLVGGLVAASLMAVSLGAVTPAGASTTRDASSSAFCTTLISYHWTAPSSANYTKYKAWVKQALPFYEKLASEAPNTATKNVLNEVVTVLKAYESSGSLSAFALDQAKYQKQWIAGSKALAAAIISCAKSLG